jgi:hypothetical protein
MINLEELKLYLSVMRVDSAYIDGIQLYDQFLIYMTQLNTFTFNIQTTISSENDTVELQSNEDIQRSFIGRYYQQVESYVLTDPMKTEGICHIYSLPFDFEHFIHLGNTFQGCMFHKVRYLKMGDNRPFEYNLFQIISQDFSFLQFLYIENSRPRKNKKNSSTLITFPCLIFLDLQDAHIDYAELFLLKKNIRLPRLLNLCIKYQSLKRITKNFTDDAMHFNFETLKSLDVCQPFDRSENFHRYFPLL